MVSRGVVGHRGVFGQAVPCKVVVLGLSAGGVPPRTAVPLILSLLEAPAGPSVDFVHLKDGQKAPVNIHERCAEHWPCHTPTDIARHGKTEALTLNMQTSIATADVVNMMAGNSMNTAAATLVLKNVMAANQPLRGRERRTSLEQLHSSWMLREQGGQCRAQCCSVSPHGHGAGLPALLLSPCRLCSGPLGGGCPYHAPHPEKPTACRTVRMNCMPKTKKKVMKLKELSDLRGKRDVRGTLSSDSELKP